MYICLLLIEIDGHNRYHLLFILYLIILILCIVNRGEHIVDLQVKVELVLTSPRTKRNFSENGARMADNGTNTEGSVRTDICCSGIQV